jgi:magnesium transporter
MLRAFSRHQNALASCDTSVPDLVWIDLLDPTPDEIGQVQQALSITLPSRAEAEEIELSSRLYAEEGAMFMTLTALTQLDTEAPAKTPVTFILKQHKLVTVRYADPKPFTAYLLRAQRPRAVDSETGEKVMLGLLEALVDRVADALERLGDETDGISREIFKQSGERANKKTRNLENLVNAVGHKAELLTLIQESLVSMTRLVAYYAASSGTDSEGRLLRMLQRDAGSLTEHARALSARLSFLLDATLGAINLEQNQIIKIFSVAAVVFLPPTLVASIYGMNYTVMPELDWTFGYPFALGLMVVSALLPFLYFKRKGWL